MRRLITRFLSSRYLVSLGTGYAQMAVMILIALAQVPLFLSYLGKAQFGLWVLAVQAASWLQLLDGGMNGALARYLIDYRHDPAGGALQRCLATGVRVLCLQGVVVMLIAGGLGSCGELLFALEAGDAAIFRSVMWVLGLSGAISFAGKVTQAWLYGCQRLDLANLIGLALTLVEFALVWVMLHLEWGLMSLAWARLTIVILGVAAYWWICVRYVEFPWRLMRSGWDVAMFRQLFSFGGGMFLITLGALLLSMTQTAMTARYLGMAAAAVWATAPKVFVMVQQMVCKLWDYRVPHLSTLMAQGKNTEISGAFLRIFGIVACIGGGGCGVLAAINPAFLEIWTGGRIHWEPVNDTLMAASVYVFLIVRCVTDFVLHTKKVGWMPVLICVEGTVFVISAAWLLPLHGLTGMLVASLAISGVLRLPYAWKMFRNFLGEDSPRLWDLAQRTMLGAALGVGAWLLLSQVPRWWPSLAGVWILSVQCAMAALLMAPVFIRLATSIRRA
jgi:O-antigen/teichoic acid export membrane protein